VSVALTGMLENGALLTTELGVLGDGTASVLVANTAGLGAGTELGVFADSAVGGAGVSVA